MLECYILPKIQGVKVFNYGKGDGVLGSLHGRPIIFTALLLEDSKTGGKVHDEKIVNNLNSKKD